MTVRALVPAVLIAVVLVLSGTTPASAAPRRCAGATQPVRGVGDLVHARSAVECLVARARRAHRLRGLRENRALESAATDHASDMVRRSYFSHVTPEGGSMLTRVTAVGYAVGSWQAGEVLATGSGVDSTPARLVAGLLRSPEHRQILLDGRLRDVGTGITWGTASAAGPQAGATLVLVLGRR